MKPLYIEFLQKDVFLNVLFAIQLGNFCIIKGALSNAFFQS
nr:MAG TPA: hypothetical protein [Caudoviricetes sp.]